MLSLMNPPPVLPLSALLLLCAAGTATLLWVVQELREVKGELRRLFATLEQMRNAPGHGQGDFTSQMMERDRLRRMAASLSIEELAGGL